MCIVVCMTNINEQTNHIERKLNIIRLQDKFKSQNDDAGQVIDSALEHITEYKFDFLEHHKGGVTFFAPKGRVSNSTVGFIRERIYSAASETGCKIVFNLRFVNLIDSVGLGVLITAHKKAVAEGGMVVFAEMNDRIMKTMKMLYMDRFLNITPDMKSAVKLLNS